VFQPAEEGRAGAKEMIKEGVLEDGPFGPRIDAIYGIHIWSACPVGGVQCSDGPVMAASDRFDISVKGKGGHGAMPAGTVDAIVEAAAVVTSLQTIITRNKDPTQTGVVTCGMINGGYGYNIIPDQVAIVGTCRLALNLFAMYRSFDPCRL
jgi:amidohydrolase